MSKNNQLEQILDNPVDTDTSEYYPQLECEERIKLALRHNSGGRFGHQMKDVMSAFIISELFGYEYVYEDYKLLDFMGYGDGERRIESLGPGIRPIVVEETCWEGHSHSMLVEIFSKINEEIKLNNKNMIVLSKATRVHLYQVCEWFNSGLIDRDIYSIVRNKLKNKFKNRHQSTASYFNKDEVNVAVHIRRGDLVDSDRGRGFLNPNQNHFVFPSSIYKTLVRKLEDLMQGNAYKIHVYTEIENSEDVMESFEASSCIVHRGEELGSDLFHLIFSDILVMSNSSLSTLAGYYSSGIKLYHPNNQCKNLPINEFVAFDEHGNFNTRFIDSFLSNSR